MLSIGQQAPGFALPDETGRERSLDDCVREHPAVVYFYPADFTPGCTAQACSFRDGYRELADAGFGLVGISAQSPDSHARFRARHDLPFPLLSDPGRRVIRAYGAVALGFLPRRVSYLIDRGRTVRERMVADLDIAAHRRWAQRLIAAGASAFDSPAATTADQDAHAAG